MFKRLKIFIFGNQKSGTTAVSRLLEIATGKKTLHDFPPQYYQVWLDFFENNISFDDVYSRTKKEFRKHYIIKEPQLTFAYEHIKKKYPDSTYVFIFRDPRDNIRSILNRLKLKGDLDNLNIDKLDIIDPWKEILKSKNVGVKTNHYIKNLSHRWNIAFNNCYNNDKNIIIVKYEDFLKNKVGFIKDLCDKTKLKYKTDITNFTEIQYQPKGDGNASWVNFFGEANLRNINTICSDGIKHLEYDK